MVNLPDKVEVEKTQVVEDYAFRGLFGIQSNDTAEN